MLNANLISLIFGLVIVLILVLGALWGFLAGLKRELKCLAVFVVVLGLMWVIFGGSASIDKNVMFGLSGTINSILGTPANCTTWREIAISFGQNNLGLKEILIEGTHTYSLFMNVVSIVVRGVYLTLGTIIALGVSGIIRLITHIVELIIRAVKNKKAKKEAAAETHEKKSRVSMKHRLWGAGVGFLKSCLLVTLICAPVVVLTGTVNNLGEESKNNIEKVTLGNNAENTVIDWVFDIVETLDDNIFVNLAQSTKHLFGKSVSDSLFDSAFKVKTEDGVLYLRAELNKLLEVADVVLPTLDLTKTIPVNVWSLSEEELDLLFDLLAESKLVQSAIPVALEYIGQMDNIQVMLKEAGLKNLNDFVKEVDWESDLAPLLQTVKKALKVVNLNEPLDVMNLNSESLKDLINTLGDTTFFKKLMPVAIDVALSLTIVKNFVGDVEISGKELNLDWKNELINLVDVYGLVQTLDIDLQNVNLTWLVNVIENENDFKVLSEALEKLSSGGVFNEVIVPILDVFVERQIEANNLQEFKGLLSLAKMESEDWGHDLPIVLEMIGLVSKLGVLSNVNDIKLNDYETMHELIDALFELVILSDKVKVSVDTVDLKTLVVEAALRQFGLLDAEGLKFELLELRSEIDWNKEKENLHKLINTFEGFSATVNDVQGFEITKIADFAALDFNQLLAFDGLWDNVLDLLDSVVDSKLISSALPYVFERYISPIIFQVNGEIGEIGLFEKITAENVLAELYNLVYLAIDLREIGVFDVEAIKTLEFNFGARAFIPERGFYQSEYFTYEPAKTDLALVDIVERVFASAILKGREGRFIRILLAGTLGVNVSVDELEAINYSQDGSLSEKTILVNGINELKPLLTDPDFKIFVQDVETGTNSFNINYFLEKDNLGIILTAVEKLIQSEIVTCLAPEMYNQMFVAKGVIPADWAKILAVQSTYLELSQGISKEEFKEDILSLIKLVEEIVKLGVVDIIDAEKAKNVRIEDLVNSATLALDTVVELNIIDGKLGTIIKKVVKDSGITLATSNLEVINWDNELTSIKNVIGNVGNIAENSGFIVYGDIQEFLATQPMKISPYLTVSNISELSEVFIELFNTELVYDLVHGYVFDKLLANNVAIKELLLTDFYTSNMFKEDLLIFADICYQLTRSSLILSLGTFIFPEEAGLNFPVNLANDSIAYLLEDIFSLNIVDNAAYNIFDTVLKATGLEYDVMDLVHIELQNRYLYGKAVFNQKATKPNTFSEYNKNLQYDEIVSIGDAFLIKHLYLSLFPIFEGKEFPINDTASLKNFIGAFTPEKIEEYKKSENLNTYALALADALEVFSEMTIARVALTPAMSIVNNMNIAFGEVTLSEMLAFDEDFTKEDLLSDVGVLANIIRNAVNFGLLDSLVKDTDILWVENEIYAQNIVKDFFKLNVLETNIETLIDIVAKTVTNGQVEFELTSEIDLVQDGEKIANAYPYVAQILENSLNIKKISELMTLKVDPNALLTTDAVSNALDAVREIITMSLLEASLTSVSEIIQNTNLHPAIKELVNLSDITALEILQSVSDLTYPAKELVKLNVLDLLQKKDISLEKIDTVPAIIQNILNNKYISTKYASLLELVRVMLGISVDSFNAYNVDWNYETEKIVSVVTGLSQIVQNCGFKTVNDIIALMNNLADVRQYLTVDNATELVNVLEDVITSHIVEDLGTGFYTEKLLPAYKESLEPVVYNLIKVDEKYTKEDLLSDLRKVVYTLRVVVKGDLLDIVVNDKEINYVRLTNDLRQILNYVFGLEILNDKIDNVYQFVNKMYSFVNLKYIDYSALDLATDADTIANGYGLIALLLDSEVNPYQKLSSFADPNAKINLAKASQENLKYAIDGLKLINDTSLVRVNNVVAVEFLKQMFANIDTTNLVGAVISEAIDIPLEDNNYVLVSEILHDDINKLLDICGKEVDIIDMDMFSDIYNYNFVDTILTEEVDLVKELLELRYLTELKGQDLLETGLGVFGINDRLDFTTLTYENEKVVIGRIIEILPNIIKETKCKSYNDIVKFINDAMLSLQNGQLDVKSVVSKGNVTNIIKVLEELEASEILKQAFVPLYQAICHPMFEQTNNQGFIDFTHIDEVRYPNEAFIADYTGIVDMLIALDEFGIYDILFNDGVIDWSNVEVVEKTLRVVFESNIFKYKENQLVKSIVHTYSKTYADINLIDANVIKLSSDVNKIVEAYKGLVPVLTKNSFPLQRLSDLTKEKVTIYIKDYIDHETLTSVVEAVRALNGTTLNEGTLAFTTKMAMTMLNNESINKILSYQNRGLNNQDIQKDIDTLLTDVELLIDAGIVDLYFGTDINIILPEVYEQIIRDVFELNILDGQYAEVVKFVSSMFGIDASSIDTSKLDQKLDKELLVGLVKSAVTLLENNGFTTVSSLNKLIRMVTFQETVNVMDYFTVENCKELLNIVKDAISLTVAEAIVPSFVNSLTGTYIIQQLRPLLVFDDTYSYADLKADFNNHIYPAANDLLDFGIVGILKYNDIINWDKQKADNTYYGTSLITDLLSIKYLEVKKSTIYDVFLSTYYPGVDVNRIILTNEISNFTSAFEDMLPVLTSDEWAYNTVSDLVGIMIYGFNIQNLLTKTNTSSIIEALRDFDDSVLLEEVMGPFFESISSLLASFIDFSVVANANAELAEYTRLLNIFEKLNEIGYFEGTHDEVETEALADLIDMIFGNETVNPAVEGLMCIVDQGECIKMLYDSGLLPSIAGTSPNIEGIADDKWHEEIVALSNIIHALGKFSAKIDLDAAINNVFDSTNVEALENILTCLNKSHLYREILYRAILDANRGVLSKYTTSWFNEQANIGMNEEWDQEVIILARLFATMNTIGGIDSLDIDNYTTIQKGYVGGDAVTDDPYLLEVNGEKAGLRQIYQLLMASKTYNIDSLKDGIELYLGL